MNMKNNEQKKSFYFLHSQIFVCNIMPSVSYHLDGVTVKNCRIVACYAFVIDMYCTLLFMVGTNIIMADNYYGGAA